MIINQSKIRSTCNFIQYCISLKTIYNHVPVDRGFTAENIRNSITKKLLKHDSGVLLVLFPLLLIHLPRKRKGYLITLVKWFFLCFFFINYTQFDKKGTKLPRVEHFQSSGLLLAGHSEQVLRTLQLNFHTKPYANGSSFIDAWDTSQSLTKRRISWFCKGQKRQR